MGYGFILNMWMMDRMEEEVVRSFVPLFITQDEADMILITPKLKNYSPTSVRNE